VKNLSTKLARKEKSHERILAAACSKLRKSGLTGITVNGVMRDAGMTVGGFYAHFPNRQTLLAEALRSSLNNSFLRLESLAAGRRGSRWVLSIARAYLSPEHRDNPESGCPLPASLGEIPRSGETVKDVLAEEMQRFQDVMSEHLKESGVPNNKSEALALISLMIGGISLSHALRGSPLSDEVLKSCRDHIERFIRSKRATTDKK